MTRTKIKVPILASIGHGGWTIYYADQPDGSSTRVHGYGDLHTPGHHGDSLRQVHKQGVPIVDSREIDDADLIRLSIAGPMPATGKPDEPIPGTGIDSCGYSSLSYMPISEWIAMRRKFGAIVLNAD